MQFMPFSASSERHIGWAEDILTSMEAHQSQNYLLDDQQRKVLGTEAEGLRKVVDSLEKVVEERNREIVKRLRVLRAQQRVADFICDTTVLEVDAGLRPHRKEVGIYLPGGFRSLFRGATLSRVLNSGAETTAAFLLDAAEMLQGLPQQKFRFADKFAARLTRAGSQLDVLNKEYQELMSARLTYSSSLQRGEVELREALQQMNGRLRSYFSAEFIESLYPRLSTTRSRRQDKDDFLDEEVELEVLP